jgi:2-methylcitrate dehydratase PrpD
MDAINVFVKHIKKTTYKSLPSVVIETTKKQIMDTIAVAIAGSTAEPISELIDIFTDWGGKAESTVWLYGKKLPSIAAAQINATMVHARDFDDTHDAAIVHPSVVTIPVGFAMAERLGKVDGKSLITACALGIDLCSRLCFSCTNDYFAGGWHFTPLHGTFSAAAVAGKLIGLDDTKLLNAFGIAYHQAAGNLQCVDDGALTKRCGPGFASRNGIISAIMAEKSITGATQVLQGQRGLFKQYHRNAYNPKVLTKDLGVAYEGVNVSFKPYPCCRHNHPGIDATIALMKEFTIQAKDVERILVQVGSTAFGVLADPIDVKRKPRNAVDAQFSYPWAIASTIVHGKVTIGDITDKATKNKDVLAVSEKVSVQLNKDLSMPGIAPSIVSITIKGGKTYSKRVDVPYGSPKNPMSLDAIAMKLRDAVPYGCKHFTAGKVDKLIDAIAGLEKVKDMSEIISLIK